MSFRSFQTRLIVLAILLSASVLAILGILGWVIFSQLALHRLDREIANWAQFQLSKPRSLREWSRFEQDMTLIFGGHVTANAVALLVTDRSGISVYRSANWQAPLTEALRSSMLEPQKWVNSSTQPFSDPSRESHSMGHSVAIGKADWRLLSASSPDLTLAMAVNLAPLQADLARVRKVLIAAFPIALLINGLAAWFVARRVNRSIQRVSAAARRVTARALDERIAPHGSDLEFAELICVFNQMLDRLERSFMQATRFSADAAHELKTPLTILQGILEQAQREVPFDTEVHQVFDALTQEVQRLKAIVQKLLLLAKADAGQLRLTHERMHLAAIISELLDDLSILAPGITVETSLDASLEVLGDADLLRQVLQNLTSNAIKFNIPSGRIVLNLSRNGSMACFSIANTGTRIPSDKREHIFERFYRAESSHARRIDGAGLGLSLARELVQAHGGQLILMPDMADLTIFQMSLPLAT